MTRESTGRNDRDFGFIMVRTTCCETYKCTGTRCSACPNRPENKAAVQQFRENTMSQSLGRRLGSRPVHEYAELQETAAR